MKGTVIAEIKIIPLGTTTTSLSRYVATCVSIVKKTPDMKCQPTAMGTIIEGPLKQILELVQEMHEIPFTMGAKRVLTEISIDDRRDKEATIESKVKAIT